MAAELVTVDRLPDDPVFFEPYRKFFDPIRASPRSPRPVQRKTPRTQRGAQDSS